MSVCVLCADNDDLDSARGRSSKAQQALPDSPTLAYIEAMLLLHEGHEREAKERANFWYRRLVRQGDLDDEQLDFLAALADNPGATLADQLLSAEEDLATPLISLQALLAALPVAPKIAINTEADTGHLQYHTSAREQTLFAAWHEQFKVLVDEDIALGFRDDPWGNAVEWMSALCAHPEWLDAPQVVQDLTMALTSRFGSLPWMAPAYSPRWPIACHVGWPKRVLKERAACAGTMPIMPCCCAPAWPWLSAWSEVLASIHVNLPKNSWRLTRRIALACANWCWISYCVMTATKRRWPCPSNLLTMARRY